MAITITLVEQGNNRLRYLLVADASGSLSITTTGAASPDLLTDSVKGPIKRCAQAFTNGIGILAAGAKTATQARAIWLAENADTILGNAKVPRAICQFNGRTGVAQWSVNSSVDGGGHPTIDLTSNAAGSAYLDVISLGAIGV